MMKIGYLDFDDNKKDKYYYTSDFKQFFRLDGTILNDEELKIWAVLLNNPWAQDLKHYVISIVADNMFECEYHATVCDDIMTGIIGYGDTEVNALNECMSNFKKIQSKYNLENIRG